GGREGPGGGAEGGGERLERGGAPRQEIADRSCSEVRRDEALVHAVARHRVDQPRRVADEQGSLPGDPGVRTAKRKPVPSKVLEVSGLEAVRSTGFAQELPNSGPVHLPRTDADVHVVSFWKDPAVAA